MPAQNHAVEERPTLTAVRALNDGWHNQLCKHDPHQQEAHENQQQADLTRRNKAIIVTGSLVLAPQFCVVSLNCYDG